MKTFRNLECPFSSKDKEMIKILVKLPNVSPQKRKDCQNTQEYRLNNCSKAMFTPHVPFLQRDVSMASHQDDVRLNKNIFQIGYFLIGRKVKGTTWSNN